MRNDDTSPVQKQSEKTRTFRIPLRAVFYQENNLWFAHSLDMDLIGEGASKEFALQQLSAAILQQIEFSIEHKNMLNIFQPADARFHEMFAAGKDIAIGQIEVEKVQKFGIELSRLEAREYVPMNEEDHVFV